MGPGRSPQSSLCRNGPESSVYWGNFQLGTLLLWRYQTGELDRKVWEQLVPFVVEPFDSVAGLADALPKIWDPNGPLRELEKWELSDVLRRTHSMAMIGSQASDTALLWATLLLLRRTEVPRRDSAAEHG